MAALEQDGDWKKLSADQRETILAKHGLHEVSHPSPSGRDAGGEGAVSVDVSTPESILDALERCSLSQWGDRTQALKGRFEQARLEVAKLLEPKVQRVNLPRRTLKDEAELGAWLAEAEALIRGKLGEGPVMI
jgi:hypothetical protein